MKPTYVIGEIGQNHNGDVEIAKQLVDAATAPVVDKLFDRPLRSMDAVKMTKRDLAEELSKSAMSKPYNSPHSYGKTYGEHRAALELSEEAHFEVYQYAKAKGIDFVETLCAVGCINMLRLFTPDYLKVASRDLTNLPLLDAMGETKIPIILSTGMANREDLDNALEVLTRHHSDITILHCISQYPADYPNINLRTIEYLKEHYKQYRIGYSDHSIGIVVPIAAVVLGAEVIEKHITLDRNMKGSDHQGSLEPDGIWRMMRDMRNIELSMGTKDIFASDAIAATRVKLERSVATKAPLKKGHVMGESDLHLLSPGDGFKWAERDKVVGKVLKADIPADEIIYPQHLEDAV